MRIVIEQVEVEVRCVGERAFDVQYIYIVVRSGAVEDEATEERVGYDTADDELDTKEIAVEETVAEDFEREDEHTPPNDENHLLEGEQPCARTRLGVSLAVQRCQSKTVNLKKSQRLASRTPICELAC